MISSKPFVAVVVFLSILTGFISFSASSRALAADDQPQKGESSRTAPSKSEVVTPTEKQVGNLSARIDALTTRVQRLERTIASQKTHELNLSDSRVGALRIGNQVGSVREQPTDVKIQVFCLVNADAPPMVRILSQLLPEVETKKVRIVVDKRTNSVLAYGNAQDLGIIEALLLRLDEAVEHRTNDKE